MDINVLKGQAKRLASYCTQHNIPLKLGQAQDAVAVMNEKRDWNTLVASNNAGPSRGAGAEGRAPAETSPFIDSTDVATLLLTAGNSTAADVGDEFNAMVKAAYFGHYPVIHLIQTEPSEAEIRFLRRGEVLGHDITVERLRELATYAFSIADAGMIPFVPGIPSGVGLQFEAGQVDGLHIIKFRFVGMAASEQLPRALRALGYTPSQIEQLKAGLGSASGVFVVASKIGSGRSTTAHRIVDAMTAGTNRKVVLVGSDYSQASTNAVRLDADLIADPLAIRRLHYLDPDVVIIDEVRDRQLVEVARTLAMAGMQVWLVVHADSPASALERLAGGLSDAEQRQSFLHPIGAVIAQTLLPRLCDACKRPAAEVLSTDELQQVSGRFGEAGVDRMYVRNGQESCARCKGSGIAGQVIAAEIHTPKIVWDRMTILQRASELVHAGHVDPRDVD